MAQQNSLTKSWSVGDAAVEGLLDGILAGIVMAVLVVVFGWISGTAPLTALGYFTPDGSGTPLEGVIVHFAVAGVYGVLFGIVWVVLARTVSKDLRSYVALIAGALYGLALFGIAESLILPTSLSGLHNLPLWAMVTAHLAYGLVLASLLNRNHK